MLDFLIEFGDYLLLVINHLNYVRLLVAGFLEMFEVLKPAQAGRALSGYMYRQAAPVRQPL